MDAIQRKMWHFILLGIFVSSVHGHIINRASILKLEDEVNALKREQERMYTMLDALETDLTSKIATHGLGLPGVIETQSLPGMDTNYEERLSEMEGKIDAIKTYLMGEKKVDMVLRDRSEGVINQMTDKVTETGTVIEDLKIDVQNSITKFKDMIVDVNRTANVKINANGAVLYGGIGSACTSNGGECVGEDSECRGGRCQCIPGLSYDVQSRACVESCRKYGETYQSVSRKIIRGFNDDTLKNITLAECKEKCIKETKFTCRSFDYFQHWHTCYLSQSVKSEGTAASWEYNSEGIHFQRDCE